MMISNRLPFLAGLFFTTCATLQIEILCTRLLSVMAWYHLSFLAVSIAMLGMAAGAVRVYTNKAVFAAETAPSALARYSTYFSVSIPVCHAANLSIPIVWHDSVAVVVSTALTILFLTVPFFFSGVVVAVALTRVPGPTGRVYAFDLAGAALGSLLVVQLLDNWSISAAMFLSSAIAAAGALCFHVFASTGRTRRAAALMVLLVVLGSFNDRVPFGLRVVWSKGVFQVPGLIVAERWTNHGQVTVRRQATGEPQYWGKGDNAPDIIIPAVWMAVDGLAGTSMSHWDQRLESLEWTSHDVTALAYHLRPTEEVAVIGVGGGRDLLTALWSGAGSVTGIEVNRAFIDFLEGRFRIFAGLADHPEVTLVHDEARSFLTRTNHRFGIIQMSMIDSWAATGAGAFTLSENGLYTIEGWTAMLDALEPGGLFTVSRWHSVDRSSETGRLISLATAVLLKRGIGAPEKHLMLVGRNRVATLVLSLQPFSEQDLDKVSSVARDESFDLLVAPGSMGTDAQLGRLSRCRSLDELDATVAHPLYDQRPPTDERPFFFNLLSPRGVFDGLWARGHLGVAGTGNLIASIVLALLWIIVFLCTIGFVVIPLLRYGIPAMTRNAFSSAVAYFALIGLGFMFVQIPLLQRFSVFLGHPTYALAVILFAMILFAGVGSLLSDRLPEASLGAALAVLPGLAAALLLAATVSLQFLIEGAIGLGLFSRCVVVVFFVGVVSLPLGMFFPLGLRFVRRVSDEVSPWLWGINGAAGVLAAVSAVAVSMWWGISVSLLVAAAAYAALYIPIRVLGAAQAGPPTADGAAGTN